MKTMSIRAYRLAVVLALGLVIASCSSGPRIITNSDPSADWSQYRTFGFFNPLGTDRNNVRSLMSTQLIDEYTAP